MMVLLLWREDEQEDEGALEVRVEDEDECREYLGSGRLVWAMVKACLLFRDIIIIFAGARTSESSFLIS